MLYDSNSDEIKVGDTVTFTGTVRSADGNVITIQTLRGPHVTIRSDCCKLVKNEEKKEETFDEAAKRGFKDE